MWNFTCGNLLLLLVWYLHNDFCYTEACNNYEVKCTGFSPCDFFPTVFMLRKFSARRSINHLSFTLFPQFFFLGGCCTGGIKFPGQGSNPCHSTDPSQSSDNAGSLIHWTIRELQIVFFLFRAAPVAYGSSRARVELEPHLRPTP